MSDADSAFGSFRCTAAGVSHYYLPRARRALCGSRLDRGEEAMTPSGAVFSQRACRACVEANVGRWARTGGRP